MALTFLAVFFYPSRLWWKRLRAMKSWWRWWKSNWKKEKRQSTLSMRSDSNKIIERIYVRVRDKLDETSHTTRNNKKETTKRWKSVTCALDTNPISEVRSSSYFIFLFFFFLPVVVTNDSLVVKLRKSSQDEKVLMMRVRVEEDKRCVIRSIYRTNERYT